MLTHSYPANSDACGRRKGRRQLRRVWRQGAKVKVSLEPEVVNVLAKQRLEKQLP